MGIDALKNPRVGDVYQIARELFEFNGTSWIPVPHRSEEYTDQTAYEDALKILSAAQPSTASYFCLRSDYAKAMIPLMKELQALRNTLAGHKS